MEKHPHIYGRRFLSRIIMTGTDGILITLGVSAALEGSGFPLHAVLIAVISAALADVISTSFGGYFSMRSEASLLRQDIERESLEIREEPQEEEDELREIFHREGFLDDTINAIIDDVRRDPQLWIVIQLLFELHEHPESLKVDSVKHSVLMAVSLFLGSLIPLIPYFAGVGGVRGLAISLGLGWVALFVMGSTKITSFRRPNFKDGLEISLLGVLAAGLLYLLGTLLPVAV